MINNLKCPYCQQILSDDFGVIFCLNEACEIYGCELNEQVIRDIIDGKAAQDALKRANAKLDLIANHSGTADTGARELRRIAKNGLNEIASITTGKDK